MKEGVSTYCKMVVEVSQLPHPATSISTVATHDLKVYAHLYGKEVLESHSMSFFFHLRRLLWKRSLAPGFGKLSIACSTEKWAGIIYNVSEIRDLMEHRRIIKVPTHVAEFWQFFEQQVQKRHGKEPPWHLTLLWKPFSGVYSDQSVCQVSEHAS